MGLDTFASRSPADFHTEGAGPWEPELTEEDLRAFKEAGLNLCGGMYSGDGSDGSFRGKVYVDIIDHITGEYLSQEWIPADTVRQMSEALQACDPKRTIEEYEGYEDCTVAELIDLQRFFRICADRGLGLIGWS